MILKRLINSSLLIHFVINLYNNIQIDISYTFLELILSGAPSNAANNQPRPINKNATKLSIRVLT